MLVYQDQVAGWMNELRNPETWMPGTLAIDDNGNQWIANGGDDYNGAKQWKPK